MASTGAIKAGRAFVEIGTDNSPLIKGLKRSTRLLNDYASRAASIGTKMVATGAALLTPVFMAISAGSDMQETMNKFNVVFADNAKAVKAWGDEYGDQVGRSKRQIADFLASNQDLLVPMGFEPGAAEQMSKDITKLSVDLASFNNKQDADVLNDLQAALTGSGEVMKKYGVIVSEAAVKQELMNMQLNPKTVAEAQKAQARWNIILRGTTAAQGDAARSANSWANQEKALAATIEDVSGEIGEKLLPVVTPLLTMFKDGVKTVGSFIAANAGIVFAVAGAGAALITLGGAVLGVALALKVLAIGFGFVTTVLGAVLSPVGLLIGGLAAIVYYSGIGGEALNWLTERFGFLGEFAKETFGFIKAALNAGEFKLAAQLLWASIKYVWYRGTNDILDNLGEWKKFFLDIWHGAIDNASSYFIESWASLQTAWVEITTFFADSWSLAMTSAKNAYIDLAAFIAKQKLELEFGDTSGDKQKEFAKKIALAAVDEQAELRKRTNTSERDNTISQRMKESENELKRIEDDRKKAQDGEGFWQGSDRRQRELDQAREERQRRLAETGEEIKALRNEISLLPKPEDTALGQSAASGAAGVKKAPGFQATKVGTGGDGPVNLRSETGIKLIADLINQSGQDRSLTELETQTGYLGDVARILNDRLLKTGRV